MVWGEFINILCNERCSFGVFFVQLCTTSTRGCCSETAGEAAFRLTFVYFFSAKSCDITSLFKNLSAGNIYTSDLTIPCWTGSQALQKTTIQKCNAILLLAHREKRRQGHKEAVMSRFISDNRKKKPRKQEKKKNMALKWWLVCTRSHAHTHNTRFSAACPTGRTWNSMVAHKLIA